MRITRLAALAVGGVLSLSACDLEINDLNNPGIDELESKPDAVKLSAATTGLLIGNRFNKAAPNGYVSQLGIIGRESYNFDAADPRYISELIEGQLNSGSPIGGNFWARPYTNIQLGNKVLRAVEKVTDGEVSPAGKAGIRGFTKTIQALDLLEVINTHDTNGAVVDTDRAIDQPLGPIVDKTTTLTAIAALLDSGLTELTAAGDSGFAFLLSEGFSGFDRPADFLKFNRGLRARVAAYQKDYDTALTALAASFLDEKVTADLDTGVFYTYTTKAGDLTNALINPNIFAHPSIVTDAQKNGADPDLRVARKVATVQLPRKPGASKGLSSSLGFKMYTSPSSPVPILRNEELILLHAEALFFKNRVAEAVTALNVVRTRSGGLAEIAGTPSETAFVDALLYERRYSLLFEGHRWIDLRRFGRLATLPIDKLEHTRNVRYPIPLTECNARPNEERCLLGSL